jgi:hypothetical protein
LTVYLEDNQNTDARHSYRRPLIGLRIVICCTSLEAEDIFDEAADKDEERYQKLRRLGCIKPLELKTHSRVMPIICTTITKIYHVRQALAMTFAASDIEDRIMLCLATLIVGFSLHA